MFKVSRISEPFHEWKYTSALGWKLVSAEEVDAWIAHIDFDSSFPSGMRCWQSMIEVRANTEEEVKLLANEIVSHLNSKKSRMVRILALGDNAY